MASFQKITEKREAEAKAKAEAERKAKAEAALKAAIPNAKVAKVDHLTFPW